MVIESVDSESIKRLCAGQVITTLYAAVKELVENSIDAEGKNVEILFKNFGLDSFQVTDDGKGIHPSDHSRLGKKHYTSKLSSFEDIVKVNTLGFRGEALSSLATMSKQVTIITNFCEENNDLLDSSSLSGYKMELNSMSEMVSRSPIARTRGTTVIVQELFCNYPVRQQELAKSIKQQFSRTLEILNGYALSFSHIRFLCVNLTKNGCRNVVFKTSGCGDLKICSVELFGSGKSGKFKEFLFEDNQLFGGVKVSGIISIESAVHESFIFLDNRPVEIKRIVRSINEVYKELYNPKGQVFLILFIHIKEVVYDVNITPDKRKVFIDGENELIVFIKKKFIDFFSNLEICDVSKNITSTGNINKSQSKKLVDNEVLSTTDQQESRTFTLLSPAPSQPNQDCAINSTKEMRQETLVENQQINNDDYMGLSNNGFQSDDTSLLSSLEAILSTQIEESENPSDPFTLQPTNISKEDFLNMKIIGQFNKGFIIASLERESHQEIFIIDQHAADEKFNYESLKDNYRFTLQRLIIPIELNLSSSDEQLVSLNLSLLKNHGFVLAIDESKDPTKKVSLIAQPVIVESGQTLGVEDLYDLLLQIRNNNQCIAFDNSLKCPRLHSIFASKACRMSIMIGESLSHKKMTKILHNLAMLNQPWVVYLLLSPSILSLSFSSVELPTRKTNN